MTKRILILLSLLLCFGARAENPALKKNYDTAYNLTLSGTVGFPNSVQLQQFTSDYGASELLMSVVANGGNVLVLENKGTVNAFSALTIKVGSIETATFGSTVNSGTFWMPVGKTYIETSSTAGAPPDFMLAMDGKYNGTDFYYNDRFVVHATGSFEFNTPSFNNPNLDQTHSILRLDKNGNITQGLGAGLLPSFAGTRTFSGLNIWADGLPGGLAIVGNGQTNGNTGFLIQNAGHFIIGPSDADSPGGYTNAFQIRTGFQANASDPSSGTIVVAEAASGRIRLGTMNYDIANSGFMKVQIGCAESGSVAGFSTTQNGVATAFYGFPASSSTLVQGSDGSAISWRSSPGAALAGTERMNLNLSSGNLVVTGGITSNGNTVGTRVSVPANSSATGAAGQWSSDDSYFYYYGATGWRRVAGSSF